MDLVAAIRGQSQACARLGSPMYADLLARVADDVVEGGPAAHMLEGHTDAPGPSGVALRLMGSVHRLVLERRAGALAAFYPSVGGTFEPAGCWAELRRLLAEETARVEEWLDRPPQTNEVGRAAALMGGLLALEPQHPVLLHEIGSSGGLNLLAEHLPLTRDGAWVGGTHREPGWPTIVERFGSDVMPVDVRTTEGRLTLTAYVWPDQTDRHERLRSALALAQQHGVAVRRQGAGDFVDELKVVEGTCTVLWHSVMWQYLDRGEQSRITGRIGRLAEQATSAAPFAHLFLEPTRRSPDHDHEFLVVLESWPGGGRRILGTAHPHGLPVRWEDVE